MWYRAISAVVICLGVGAVAGAAESAKFGKNDPYNRIVDAYMEGNWDQLDKELRAPPRELAGLSRAQRADVTYIRQAIAESCPTWWKQCKAGEKIMIQPNIWGRQLQVVYDPTAKQAMEIKNDGRQQAITLAWNPADMDSTAPGEYGFTKGDLANLGIWQTLGTSRMFIAVPPQSLVGASESDKLRLNLCLNFWGNVTAMYYGGPPTRRWALHIYLAAFMEQYGKGPAAAPRRAAASMLLVEVLQAPSKYPSLKLPDKLEAESAEEKLAVHYKFKIGRKTHWTIAEDKAFRQAVKDFATANERQLFESGKVKLPNGLLFALDPEADKPLRPKRDEWIKAHFDKAAGK